MGWVLTSSEPFVSTSTRLRLGWACNSSSTRPDTFINDGKEYLIQVAYSIAEDSTYDRKFALFNTLDQSLKKIIITNDDVNYSTSTVEHISLARFLSMTNLEG